MLFKYYTQNGFSIFEAVLETEDERQGFRAQGPYTPIKLVDTKLRIGYVSKAPLHPDIVAAICLTVFQPFIKGAVTFPLAVSLAFAASLGVGGGNCVKAVINSSYKDVCPIIPTNVDAELRGWHGTERIIAYGGGVDSTAVALMFPEVRCVYLDNLRSPNSEIRTMVDVISNPFEIVSSNCWSLVSPPGFPSWTTIFIGALIMSADLQIGTVLSGAILESVCMMNGVKFVSSVVSRNYGNVWNRFYTDIGMRIVAPVGACSELITAKIVADAGLRDIVLFCEKKGGRPCLECPKCLRKVLLFERYGLVVNWDKFRNTKVIEMLTKRPLFFANSLSENIKHSCGFPPDMRAMVADVLHRDTSEFNNYYPPLVEIIEDELLREEIRQRLNKWCKPMDDMRSIEEWGV